MTMMTPCGVIGLERVKAGRFGTGTVQLQLFEE